MYLKEYYEMHDKSMNCADMIKFFFCLIESKLFFYFEKVVSKCFE